MRLNQRRVFRLYSTFLARVAPTPLALLRRRLGRCAGHRQRPTPHAPHPSIQWMFGLEKARSGRAGGGGRAGPRTAFSSFGKFRGTVAGAAEGGLSNRRRVFGRRLTWWGCAAHRGRIPRRRWPRLAPERRKRSSGSCGKRWPTPENPSPGLWLLKSNELRLYSAFSASMHPIPLPALQNAAGGPFWAVLSVLRGLDVYAEGMERSGNGCSAFGCLLLFLGKRAVG